MAFHVGEDDMGKFPVVVGFVCSAGVGLLSWLCLSQQYGVLVYSYSSVASRQLPEGFHTSPPYGHHPLRFPRYRGTEILP